MIAEGSAARCPGEPCAFWEHGCALSRIEAELDGKPDVARLLLDLRGALEAGDTAGLDEARVTLAHILNEEEHIEA